MGSAIAQLIPLMIGSAVMPVWIIMLLLMLRGSQGLLKASMFVAGMTTVRLVQGALFGFIFGSSDSGDEGSSDPNTIVSVLLLVVGVLMIATAIKLVLSEDDPDAPPPKWMTMIQNLSPLKAFGIGAGMLLIGAKHWVFLMSAIAVIGEAGLGQPSSTIAFLIFVLGAELLVLSPIVAYAVAPQQSASILEKAGTWLEAHNKPIVLGVSGIFGAYFLWKSLAELL